MHAPPVNLTVAITTGRKIFLAWKPPEEFVREFVFGGGLVAVFDAAEKRFRDLDDRMWHLKAQEIDEIRYLREVLPIAHHVVGLVKSSDASAWSAWQKAVEFEIEHERRFLIVLVESAERQQAAEDAERNRVETKVINGRKVEFKPNA